MTHFLAEKGKILWNIIKPRRRPGLVSGILLSAFVMLVWFGLTEPAYALFGDLFKDLLQFVGGLFLQLASLFISLSIFILKFVVELGSYNQYINSSAVNFGWILVRDVTNMFFVVILMVIAFGTVLGIEQYEWKKLLVKFVLAAVLVNFSRVICGVIIDAAQVFMMTFISAIAATAGGNLVNALSLDKVLNFSQSTTPEEFTDMNVLVSSMASCIFAFTAMITIGAYMVILLGRVISLWVLVILSPLAFVLSVIPKTQAYASQWWAQFSNNIISGPVLAFFLWLSFAVAGAANMHDEFVKGSSYPMDSAAVAQVTAEAGQVKSDVNITLNEVMEWNNLASFIIAVALMLAGIKVTQQLGVAGAGALGAAAGAATKFAMVASGAAAARWAAGKAGQAGKAIALAPIKHIGRKIQTVGYAVASAVVEGGLDKYNRFLEHRSPTGGMGSGVGDWFIRRLRIGGVGKDLATRKEQFAGVMKKFDTSIFEKESIKQAMANTAAETERGLGFKEKKKAERRMVGLEKAGEKKVPLSPSRFWGRGEEVSFGELTDTAFAKAEKINQDIADKQAEERAIARDKVENSGPMHANAARARIEKRKQEELTGPMSYPQLMQAQKRLEAELGQATDEGKRKEIKKKIEMFNRAGHLKSAGQAKDSDAIVYGSIVSAAGKGSTVGAGNLQQIQAFELSKWLHRLVGDTPEELKKAWEDLQTQDGTDHDALMEERTKALRSAAQGGYVNVDGAFKLGDKGYELADEKYWKGERRYAINSARGKTDGFKGALDQRFTPGKDSPDYVLESQDAIDNVVGLNSGLSKLKAERMRQTDVDTWEHILGKNTEGKENASDAALKSLFTKLSENSDDAGIDRLLSLIDNEESRERGQAIVQKIRSGGAIPREEISGRERLVGDVEEDARRANKKAEADEAEAVKAEAKVSEIEVKVNPPSLEGFESTAAATHGAAYFAERDLLKEQAKAARDMANASKESAAALRKQAAMARTELEETKKQTKIIDKMAKKVATQTEEDDDENP
ncbi:MAG: hypothetical protein PHD72_04205 [Patescibacteria group bacterium]|nr:hypothetical protein [Patescibacteria group bacterium]